MCFNSNIDAKRRMNVTVVVSSKHLDIFVQTMFINEKSGNLSTPTDEQASVNTPKASSGTVSTTTSIIQPAQNGNTQNHNNSSNAAQGTVQHRGRFSVLFLLQRVSVPGRVGAPSGGCFPLGNWLLLPENKGKISASRATQRTVPCADS